jgi:PST family polysaccharide transporter
MGSQGFQLAFSIVLARLLTPREFGAIGMLIVFTGFAQILSDSGLSAALIQNQQVTEEHCSTAFWLQLAIGACLTGLFFFGAPLIADFYALPILAPLTRLISIVFLVQAAGQTQSALLSKKFFFRRLAAANVGATLISGVVAVVLAWRGFGIWALAWQMVALAAAQSLLYWVLSRWIPRLIFHLDSALELGRYAIYLLGYSSVNYWLRNGDNLTIGKVLGAGPLGIYARAYQLMLLPLNNITVVFGQVMLPALSRIQDDLRRFRTLYLTAARLIALVSFPLMAGLAVLADPFIGLLLGPRWIEVVPILKIMAIVGLVQSIVAPAGWVYSALGRTRTMFLATSILGFLFVVAMVVGIQFGILGVVYAYTIWTVITAVVHLHIVGRYMGVTVSQLLWSVARITAMTAAMGGVILGIDLAFGHKWSSIIRLTAGTLMGATTYLLLCIVTRDDTFSELLGLIGMRRPPHPGVSRPDPV